MLSVESERTWIWCLGLENLRFGRALFAHDRRWMQNLWLLPTLFLASLYSSCSFFRLALRHFPIPKFYQKFGTSAIQCNLAWRHHMLVETFRRAVKPYLMCFIIALYFVVELLWKFPRCLVAWPVSRCIPVRCKISKSIFWRTTRGLYLKYRLKVQHLSRNPFLSFGKCLRIQC